VEQPVLADHPGLVTRRRRVRLGKALAPYLLSLPAGLWLLALFLVPLVVMLSLSLQTCNSGTGACVMTWHWGEFGQQLSLYHTQFLTSIYFAGAATAIDLIVSFPSPTGSPSTAVTRRTSSCSCCWSRFSSRS
jgi:ABC-type spermidine/putrescine transport system, permease component I